MCVAQGRSGRGRDTLVADPRPQSLPIVAQVSAQQRHVAIQQGPVPQHVPHSHVNEARNEEAPVRRQPHSGSRWGGGEDVVAPQRGREVRERAPREGLAQGLGQRVLRGGAGPQGIKQGRVCNGRDQRTRTRRRARPRAQAVAQAQGEARANAAALCRRTHGHRHSKGRGRDRGRHSWLHVRMPRHKWSSSPADSQQNSGGVALHREARSRGTSTTHLRPFLPGIRRRTQSPSSAKSSGAGSPCPGRRPQTAPAPRSWARGRGRTARRRTGCRRRSCLRRAARRRPDAPEAWSGAGGTRAGCCQGPGS